MIQKSPQKYLSRISLLLIMAPGHPPFIWLPSNSGGCTGGGAGQPQLLNAPVAHWLHALTDELVGPGFSLCPVTNGFNL